MATCPGTLAQAADRVRVVPVWDAHRARTHALRGFGSCRRWRCQQRVLAQKTPNASDDQESDAKTKTHTDKRLLDALPIAPYIQFLANLVRARGLSSNATARPPMTVKVAETPSSSSNVMAEGWHVRTSATCCATSLSAASSWVCVTAPGEACSSCEAVRCLHEELVGDVGSAVAFVFDDVQGGSRQLPCETPDHTER